MADDSYDALLMAFKFLENLRCVMGVQARQHLRGRKCSESIARIATG